MENINFTDEKKKNIVLETEYDDSLHNIHSWKNLVIGGSMLMGFTSVVVFVVSAIMAIIGLVEPIGILQSITACCVLEILGLGVSAFNIIRAKVRFNKTHKGKITYKQYKQLEKSGEIKRLREQYKEEIKDKWYEANGITIEEYNKKAERDIINDVKERLRDKHITEINSEKIANEVKKIIDENNDRQK